MKRFSAHSQLVTLLVLIAAVPQLLFVLAAEGENAPDSQEIRSYAGSDPETLVVTFVPCPQITANVLIGSADIDGDGPQELLVRGANARVDAIAIKDGSCLPKLFWTVDENHQFLKSLDLENDGIEELVFVTKDKSHIGIVAPGNHGGTDILRYEIPKIAGEHADQLALGFLSQATEADLLLVFNAGVVLSRIDRGNGFGGLRQVATPPNYFEGKLLKTAADVDGDGVEEVFHDRTGAILRIAASSYPADIAETKKYLWTEFPFAIPLSVHFGDFNGDGRADAVAQLPGVLGTWMGLSTPQGIVEFHVPTPQRGFDSSTSVSGDFDGDGDSELLAIDLHNANGGILRMELPEQAVLPGAEVQVDGKTIGITDAEGRMYLSGSTKPAMLTATSADGKNVSLSRVWYPQKKRKIVQRLVIPIPNPAQAGATAGYGAPPEGPRICTGFNPETYEDRWTSLSTSVCAAGYGLMGMDDGNFSNPFAGLLCCKFPYPDILLNEHIVRAEFCDPGYVATGVVWGTERKLHCTKLNTAKYRLASATPGIYWGIGMSRDSVAAGVQRLEMPPAVRYAVGRVSLSGWDDDGCVGSPIGALFVGGKYTNCSTLLFSELYTVGPEAHRVEMFPRCRALKSIYDPRMGCAD